MATDYTFMASASINGAIVVQLEDYSYKLDPIVKDDKGRVGTTATFEGEGYLEDSTPAGYAAQLALAAGAWSVSGATVKITGLGGQTELLLTPAGFVNGGPHASIEISKKPQEPLQRSVKFKCVGETAPNTKDGTAEVAWKLETSTRPDKLRQIVRTGEVKGQNALNFIVGTLKPQLLAQYPKSQWVATYKIDQNQTGDIASYTFTFVELLNSLPDDGRGNAAVSGTRTNSQSRDEQMRLQKTISYDLLAVGDPDALATFVRPATPPFILRETQEWTDYAERRLRLSFTTLEGADGNPLLDWSQTFESDVDQNPIQVEAYPGKAPDFFFKPQTAFVYVQSGRAVGAGKYPKPPDPFLSTLLEKPKVSFNRRNSVECETTWSYTMVSDTNIELSNAVLSKFERPSNPDFY